MKKMEFELYSLSDIPHVVPAFIDALEGKRKIAFYGEMGVGKTTFINGILAYFQIEEKGGSPTFSIVNEYLSPEIGRVYHFDFYRIEDEVEALDIGVEEMFYEEGYCLMEWPEKIHNLLPIDTVSVYMSAHDDCRKIRIEI